MLNIDDRFITDIMPKIGAKSTAVLLAISKHIDINRKAFPSQKTIQKHTGLGRDAVIKGIKNLCDQGLLTKDQKKGQGGRFRKNVYFVNTDLIKVFVNAEDLPLNTPLEMDNQSPPYTETPLTDFQGSPYTDFQGSPYTENPTLSINHIEVLTNKEVLKSVGKNQINLLQQIKHSLPPEKSLILIEWLVYRKEIKAPYKSLKSLNQLLQTFQNFSTEMLEQAVNCSIQNQWKGLFPNNLKSLSNANSSKTKTSRNHIVTSDQANRVYQQLLQESS